MDKPKGTPYPQACNIALAIHSHPEHAERGTKQMHHQGSFQPLEGYYHTKSDYGCPRVFNMSSYTWLQTRKSIENRKKSTHLIIHHLGGIIFIMQKQVQLNDI